jgi:type IV secretory pathway TraG/TraD family ATPase VirD4
VVLGRDGRHRVYASWEDTLLAVMPPRAGKTACLAIPTVLDAPGTVVATSNKRDLYDATAGSRGQRGPVWRFDPQAIVSEGQDVWWDPLAGVTTRGAAARMASHFAASANGAGDDGFWSQAAQDLLAALLLAAAHSDGHRDVTAVSAWLADPTSPEPARLLDASGWTGEAEALRGYQTAADRTRDSVFQTARTMTRALKDPHIAGWVTPPGDDGASAALTPGEVVAQAGAVYLLSRDGPESAAPLVAALADQLLQTAITTATQHATGRLDPPLTAVLDEAANIVPLSDLPDLYSHLGSRGIVPVGILQSWSQGERVWGQQGMRALWGAATVKLLGAGLDDAQLLADVSRLAGETPVESVGWQRGHRQHSTSASTTWRPALPVDEIRALPAGHALLLAAATSRPTRIRLQPHWQRRR